MIIPEGQQSDGRYCRYFTLGATEVDLNNRARLQALLGYFQETAGDQCQLFGSGWSDLWEKHGLCYVVVRMEIRMDRYPGTGEQIRIDTWPENRLRMIFARYGEIFDANGERIGAIVSQWALLDVNSRHFVRPNPEIVSMPDTSTLTAPFEPSNDHRRAADNTSAPDSCRAFAFDRTPVYSDFDYNRHMNNARYAEWAADTLWKVLTPDERQADPSIARLEIKFRAEIPADFVETPIRLEGNYDPSSMSFAFKGVVGDTVHFEIEGDCARPGCI